MEDKALKTELARVLHKEVPEIDEKHLDKTACLAHCVYKERKCRQRIGFGQMLLRQIKFMGWRVWGMQAVSLLMIRVGFHTFIGSVEIAARNISLLSCVIAIIMAWMVIPVIARGFKYNMYEIESASFFSGGRLLIAQMVIIIGGVLLMFSAILWFVGLRFMHGFSQVAFCLLLPYFASGNLFLYLFRRVRPQMLIRACNVAGIILLAVIVYLNRRRVLSPLEPPTAAGWGLCFLCIVFCVVQMRHIWGQKAFGGI